LLFAITLYWLPLQLYFIATAEYYHIELYSFSRISTTYKWEKNDFEIIKFHSLSSLNLHLLPIFTKFGLLSECFVYLDQFNSHFVCCTNFLFCLRKCELYKKNIMSFFLCSSRTQTFHFFKSSITCGIRQ
jgi:hypothetical protein